MKFTSTVSTLALCLGSAMLFSTSKVQANEPAVAPTTSAAPMATPPADKKKSDNKKTDAKKADTKKMDAKKTETKKESADSSGKPLPTTVDKLLIEEMKLGTGKTAVKGKTIKVDYTGWLYDPKATKGQGKQFDSSVGKEPFTFTLGSGMVIKGWDEGFKDMKVTGKRRLLIPSDMGYGSRGAGSVIPPGATLMFEVELLDVMD